ncbi:hypothetical protein [Megasphaera sp.]|jgi:cell division protein FtsB|uniref:hypothetical protein n=1 Tax=Megasphaera sp. TaxID=2023260 RepID=UPI00204FCCD4|nr:MAG TPA: GEMININ, MULTICILIN CYCLE, DNA REPLICATION LICENSING [Caudoviricetes sp.]DAM95501.1 MAG TPA: GEMININ, MULTICILIN CYCLE, DNA REPLICATION LICENSING [Caudoviricetes sp.]
MKVTYKVIEFEEQEPHETIKRLKERNKALEKENRELKDTLSTIQDWCMVLRKVVEHDG